MIGAPPQSATEAFTAELDRVRRLTALRVQTLAMAVVDPGDTVGWARLTTLGTDATVSAQQAAKDATARYAMATLEAAGAADLSPVDVPVQPGYLASGRDVQGMFAATSNVVQGRTAAGATFTEALAASAQYLVGVAASEPHRVGRDGLLRAGLSDDRFERYRRVAVGATCDFCLMLATRGAVYLSAASAGESRKYHHHCDCRIELVVGADAIGQSQELQGDWRNAMRDEQRLIDAGAMDGITSDARALIPPPAAPGALPAGWSQFAPGPGRVSVFKGGVAVDTDLWSFHGVELGTKFVDEFAAEQIAAMQEAAATVARHLDAVADANPLRFGTPLNVSITRLERGVGGITTAIPSADGEILMRINAHLFDDAERARWMTAAEMGKIQPGAAVDPLRATVSHEYGHAYAIAKGGAGGHSEVAARALAPVMDDGVQFNGFSAYGQTNIDETYAEAFAEWAMRSSLGGQVHPVTEALARAEGWS